MGVGLFVGVWVARYLGPDQFGLFNYAVAFVSLFGAIAGLGLNGVVVRDLVKEPDNAEITLGTAFVLQIFGGVLAFCVAVAAIAFIRPNDELLKLMVAVLGFAMVFKAADVVKYWFESQVQSKYSVWVENAVFLIFASVKVVLIVQRASLIAFVWVVLAEAVSAAIVLLIIYARRGGRLRAWNIRASRAKSLLKDSWPLILSGLAIMVYMRIDQIMLGQMLGDEAVGIYSAAVRISEMWYFIPTAIVASVFPAIVEAKKQSEMLYYKRLQKLYDLMVWMGILIAVPITFFSDRLIALMFGDEYEQAGAVLALHIWAGVFVFLGVASGKWFLIENLQKSAFYRTLIGMVVNIIVNFQLIPIYGVVGAAIGTLCSQIFAAYLYDAMQKTTRNSFVLKTASLLPFIFFIRKRFHLNGAVN